MELGQVLVFGFRQVEAVVDVTIIQLKFGCARKKPVKANRVDVLGVGQRGRTGFVERIVIIPLIADERLIGFGKPVAEAVLI